MLKHIPTHLIGGPLGAGKTSLIRGLLAQKPADERWAVLVNEFGQIGLDAALLADAAGDAQIAEVAGGCLCCVNGAPFQVTLSRLLRRARPDRLLIEPSGLGHPDSLCRQLQAPPWQGVLALQPLVLVLDAQALAAGQPLPDAQRTALADAGLMLLNKSDGLTDGVRQRVLDGLPAVPHRWTCQGHLPLDELPQSADVPSGTAPAALPLAGTPPAGVIWRDPRQPIRHSHAAVEGWSIGWRWHPSQDFDRQALVRWLQGLGWRRAKLVMCLDGTWQAANALEGGRLEFAPSPWRRDSRLELVFADVQDEACLDAGLAACRRGPARPAEATAGGATADGGCASPPG